MKILFIHIPKTAGTSIKQWSSENINYQNNNKVYCFGHVTYEHVIQRHKKFDWSFSSVRNTYERLISLYLYTWNKSKKRMEKGIRNNNPDMLNTFIVNQAEKGIVNFYEVFLGDNRRSELHENLVLSQLNYIKGVDYVIHYETLNNDFITVQEKLNCYISLTQERNMIGVDKRNFYSSDFINHVKKHYEEELETFRYLPKI